MEARIAFRLPPITQFWRFEIFLPNEFTLKFIRKQLARSHDVRCGLDLDSIRIDADAARKG